MIYKLVTRIIEHFCFPERPMKGGDILDFSKGGNLRKGEGVDYSVFVFVSCLESGALIVF